ncbi:methyltransferase-like protein 25B [Cydia pomonella]|uniref:methyltransferase-like protein 25B n=1 Tax=Cydia pomonella TaxID=82600 RepID=UPI002ADD421C|nr:methyltransferase-like protein 25B [Cydia pomonella]
MCSQKDTTKDAILKSLKVIRMFDWLLDLYVLDFFVDDHWAKLPLSWQECFENMTPQDLGDILSGNPTSHVLPLSFLSLAKSVEVLSLPRKTKYEKSKKVINNNEDSCASHPKLKNLFLKHVKLKKRHEISLMAEVVSSVALESNCNAVIDFGSGLGHLVRVLAYKNNLHVAGIECQSQLTEEARKLDLQLEYTASKHLPENIIASLHRPIHFNMTLTCNEQLHQLKLPEEMKTYGLVGLHPCGDLGPLLIKHFINCKQVKYICVVGCCFMKLTCEGKETGYPLSNYVKGLDSKLSYVSREIACHAIEIYLERLRKDNYDDLKVHAYRAALERILVEHDPKLKHAPVRNIKHSNAMTFQQYSTLALERLNIPVVDVARGESDLLQWRRVVTLYTLRLVLAPVVETVVLLDRVLYVLEHGLSCEIHPVFDPKLSPRNHIIVGKRT